MTISIHKHLCSDIRNDSPRAPIRWNIITNELRMIRVQPLEDWRVFPEFFDHFLGRNTTQMGTISRQSFGRMSFKLNGSSMKHAPSLPLSLFRLLISLNILTNS
eukprot:156668_1